MIKYYKYKRYEIVEKIKKEKKTPDGYYWCPFFLEINLDDNGLNFDDEYFYDRELFKYKMYFSEIELDVYLSKNMCMFDVDDMYRKSCLFHESNKSLVNHKLTEKVDNYLCNVMELIECFEYLHK